MFINKLAVDINYYLTSVQIFEIIRVMIQCHNNIMNFIIYILIY